MRKKIKNLRKEIILEHNNLNVLAFCSAGNGRRKRKVCPCSCLSKLDTNIEFCIELCVDSNDDIRAIRVIPKNYWNDNELKAKLPIDKETRDFVE